MNMIINSMEESGKFTETEIAKVRANIRNNLFCDLL